VGHAALAFALRVREDEAVTGLAMIWISTIVTTATTAVVFVLLAQWSAGGAAPWSIAPGLVRGIRDWGQRDEDLEPFRVVSPAAQLPEPPINVAALPLSPLDAARHGVASEDDSGFAVVAEVEELGTRRI
jgi:hypothetical protein